MIATCSLEEVQTNDETRQTKDEISQTSFTVQDRMSFSDDDFSSQSNEEMSHEDDKINCNIKLIENKDIKFNFEEKTEHITVESSSSGSIKDEILVDDVNNDLITKDDETIVKHDLEDSISSKSEDKVSNESDEQGNA